MKNIIYIVLTALTIAFLFTSCSKEDFDISNSNMDDFTADTIIYNTVNQFSFALSKSYNGQINVRGGSAGFGTNLSHEPAGNQTKWTLYATLEDVIIVTQTIVFYTDNEDLGTYDVAEYHLDSTVDDNINWISPDMTGGITITSLSDSLVSGSISLERIVADTTFSYSATLTDVINL